MTDCGCSSARADYSPGIANSDYHGKNVGNPVMAWPGWVDNDARYSIQADINPLPISPVHFQQWPGMQFQLSNGWQYTNYGQILSYNDYKRLLYSSTSTPGAPKPLPGEGLQPTSNSLVSQTTLQNQIGMGAPTGNGAGAGHLNPGVSLAGRTYFG